MLGSKDMCNLHALGLSNSMQMYITSNLTCFASVAVCLMVAQTDVVHAALNRMNFLND